MYRTTPAEKNEYEHKHIEKNKNPYPLIESDDAFSLNIFIFFILFGRKYVIYVVQVHLYRHMQGEIEVDRFIKLTRTQSIKI